VDRVRSTAKGQTRFKKMLEKVYLKYLRARFHQWHLNIANLDSKGETIQYNIVTKMRRRILRTAFKQFQAKCALVKKELKDHTQQAKVANILLYRHKKRMF
jgi:hypothetical protein